MKRVSKKLLIVLCIILTFSMVSYGSVFAAGTADTTAQKDNEKLSVGPVTAPIISEIAKDTYSINEFGMNSMYVLVGKKRAMVIDTGTGFCDFKSIVERITKLPYYVVLTHGHPDHFGGAGAFSTVYMNTKDVELAKASMDYTTRLNYGIMMSKTPLGYQGLFSYSVSDCRNWGDKFPTVKNMKEGKVFDLGGRKVSVIETPGHTDGSCSLLDKNSRILFAGDAVTVNYLKNETVPMSTALKGLLKLKKLSNQYDRIFGGHTNYAGILDTYCLGSTVLDDQIQILRSILSGDAKAEETTSFIDPSKKAYNVRYGSVNVQYTKLVLWEKNEKHIIP